MSVKDEYIKRLSALEQIEKIARENDFDNFQAISNLSSLYGNIKEALDIARLYKKWQLDINDYNWRNGNREIEYGIGIYTFNEITNYGSIEPEELLKISFPTGAYVFGDDYDIEFFSEFYKELHLVEPKYEDSLNKSLYYSVENGKEAYEHYRNTYKKYCDNLAERRKQNRIKQIEKELSQLKK